ncbi:PREDICTED: WPP domain-interacting protein 1-like [Camelina sativa]|uniref:WPP domain-interacting protein 1-like n=1 Tax=Camelina sativa TaxID=90675 RepID=A0ABM0UBK5_CAMSA|nr:PREDICTED: WPP domain-interacting protein 1-like [Camelina sativa]XP_010438754.1 PREDICTED: WPP domain-interacting protein 1-like [Camelina sativa]
MDLESESSALESVDDNVLIQQSASNNNVADDDDDDDDDDDGRSLDNGSFSDESVKLVSTSSTCVEIGTDNNNKPMDDFDSPGAGAVGGSSSPVSKGRGLRKWRRIRRDLVVVKDTSANTEKNSSKVLKKRVSGAAHSHGKQIMFQSSQVEQESQGSVGSVNMLKSTGDGFDLLGSTGYDSRFVAGTGFSAGIDLEKDDDRSSSKSSTAARAPKFIRYEKPMISSGQRGNSRVENSKKHRGDKGLDIDKDNSYSSLESDSRKQSGRMMDFNSGENGDEADMNGETSMRKDDAGGEGEESVNTNNRYSEELDPLTEAIDGFLALRDALEKEVQQFQEIGKEPMPQHHEQASEVSSPHSEIVTLVNNVEQLEIKLEETRSMLEVKESHIRELESTANHNKHSLGGTETMVEDTFRQKIEAEIEYLIYSRSIDNLNSQMKLIDEQESLAKEETHETLNKLGKVQMKAANLTNRAQDLQNECIEITGTIKKTACKTTSCFLIQLVLMLTVVLSLLSQLLPKPDIPVPT